MRAIARAMFPALSVGRTVEPLMLALLALLAGAAAIGGFALHTLHGAKAHVCTIVLPHRSSAIGAVVELQERLAVSACRRGDVLAVSGDVHLEVLARFCMVDRGITLQSAAADTGRPAGALCTFAGTPHGQR
jgi:hypothetical protein